MLYAIASAQTGTGKTAVLVALAQLLAERSGTPPRLQRIEGDTGAAADARTLSTLGGSGQPEAPSSAEVVTLTELPAGQSAPQEAMIIGVARCNGTLTADLSRLATAHGQALTGVVLTFVPEKDRESLATVVQEAGVRLLGLLPEDRLLASPTLAEVVGAVEARTVQAAGQEQRVLDRIFISSISADPNQGYVARLNPTALVVRSDKPDQQLAALYAGVPSLIISGTVPILPYVLERAEEDGTPLLLTALNTADVVRRIEQLYGRSRFGGAEKVQRSREIIEDRGLLETLLAVR